MLLAGQLNSNGQLNLIGQKMCVVVINIFGQFSQENVHFKCAEQEFCQHLGLK